MTREKARLRRPGSCWANGTSPSGLPGGRAGLAGRPGQLARPEARAPGSPRAHADRLGQAGRRAVTSQLLTDGGLTGCSPQRPRDKEKAENHNHGRKPWQTRCGLCELWFLAREAREALWSASFGHTHRRALAGNFPGGSAPEASELSTMNVVCPVT